MLLPQALRRALCKTYRLLENCSADVTLDYYRVDWQLSVFLVFSNFGRRAVTVTGSAAVNCAHGRPINRSWLFNFAGQQARFVLYNFHDEDGVMPKRPCRVGVSFRH